MKKLCLLLVASACVFTLCDQAHAIKLFQKEFLATYVEDSSNVAFKKAVKKAGCAVCHDPTKYPVPGKETKKASKKNRNDYGKELAKLLDRKKDKKDKAKIQDALKKVAKMKSNPKIEKSKTFGEIFKAGKLPVQKPSTKADEKPDAKADEG